MGERIHFEELALSPTGKVNAGPLTTYLKPKDAFTPPPCTPDTIFYLATIAPHTDSYLLQGPVKKFAHLLPQIQDIVSNSPSAIDKLASLQEMEEDIWGEVEKNAQFEQDGFERFVVEGQRGVYTVLEVLRERNEEVKNVLPAAIYTVIAAGPLTTPSSYTSAAVAGTPSGYAAMTRLVGSFVDRGAAQTAARHIMLQLVDGVAGVTRTETWGAGGKGGGLLMAMCPGKMWEVKVVYEDQALRRAREGLDMEGEKVGWRV
ncbi:uncharacterized protein K460DRAFT_352135 [Cucurbitaria berberidis CBS 394.84]|uniref:Uncharacterized protein n=1 Tax=Cucurbitaria berberidis CBS 394.84 TaxID=1168544 RepID=A0A9P4GKN1_9PLEO|nr:uncharacterized protein K460DRAFT_352135 [Cucurbitaria berberidis CBS 394.84]KAF1846939.1 hypothetical protein K460DRAFT_352135 [Cucurbitaria berberidis CBS 394.84]